LLERGPAGLFLCSGALLHQLLLHLAAGENEIVIVAITPPRARRNISDVDKLPIGHIGRRQPEIIADSRRHVQSGTVVQVRFWPLVSKNVLEMIRAERPAIFPLCVASAIAFAN